MRCAERSVGGQARFRRQQTGDRMNARGFETLFKRHRRQYRRNAFGEHRFAGSWRTHKQHVMTSRHRDFDSPLRMELPTYVAEIFMLALRLTPRKVGLATCGVDGLRAVNE